MAVSRCPIKKHSEVSQPLLEDELQLGQFARLAVAAASAVESKLAKLEVVASHVLDGTADDPQFDVEHWGKLILKRAFPPRNTSPNISRLKIDGGRRHGRRLGRAWLRAGGRPGTVGAG